MDTPQPQTGPTFEESAKRIIPTLPAPVRDYLGSEALPNTAHALTTKYRLHLDQGTILQRELMLVLMGLEKPEELAQTLQDEAGITADVINQILVDVNKDVFQVLQGKMRAPAAPTAQPVQRPAPAPSMSPIRAQAEPPANLPGAGQWEPNIGMPTPPPQGQTIVYSAPPQPAPTPMPQTVRPTPAAQTMSAPQQSAPTPAPQQPRPIVKEYGSDPYHEPIEL